MTKEALGNRETALNKGISWLFEHEILGAKAAQDALWLNIYAQSTRITDVKLVIDQMHKKMLIYLELSFWGKYFSNKKLIADSVMDVCSDVLPTYQMRVVYDKDIYEKARKIIDARSP